MARGRPKGGGRPMDRGFHELMEDVDAKPFPEDYNLDPDEDDFDEIDTRIDYDPDYE